MTSNYSLEELIKKLELSNEFVSNNIDLNSNFNFKANKSFISKIKKGDLKDPLLLQILPLKKEKKKVANYVKDPLNEVKNSTKNNLLYKYYGRALIIISPTCKIHCRYCFRRNFPYENYIINKKNWENIFSFLSSNEEIEEVIFSGGDPLTLTNKKLKSLTKDLETIKHLKRLRIHSRIPIILPERIDTNLINSITSTKFKTIMVVHTNHPNEIDEKVYNSNKYFKDSNITLLNQSVLLKNINDNVETLKKLSEILFESGILPYYLHLLDKVEGSSHFEVSEKNAKKLMRKLLEVLPGFLVPKLVKEIHSKRSKVPIDLNY